MAVDNTLSPHGGELKVSVAGHGEAGHSPNGLPRLPVRDQIAREVVNLSYGFFSPLNGFMDRRDVDSVVRRMTLADGTVWSIPIVFDVSAGVLAAYGLQTGGRVLLTYQDQPLAVLEISDIFDYDRDFLAQQVYGTADASHPGVERTNALDDTFIGGPVTLINPPSINPPFDRFWKTPQQLRERFAQRDWRSVVAHQTRNVPHSGHEWLMKGAWLAAEAYGEVGGEHKGILVSAVIGEKKPGDYIDEAIVLAHQRLRDDGFFRPDVHLVSTLLWDMRYAGPREAVFHALVRKNLGCTHHMFGRDHAGVGTYYDTYAAHEIFQQLPDLGIKSVLTREWWYCPACAGVAYEGLCGHPEQRQELSGTYIRSIIQGGVEPAPLTLRPEVLEVVRECAEQYGFGSPFVGDQYLDSRTPVMTMPIVEGFCCTCSGT
jgi:sulfate adenylyltransferase